MLLLVMDRPTGRGASKSSLTLEHTDDGDVWESCRAWWRREEGGRECLVFRTNVAGGQRAHGDAVGVTIAAEVGLTAVPPSAWCVVRRDLEVVGTTEATSAAGDRSLRLLDFLRGRSGVLQPWLDDRTDLKHRLRFEADARLSASPLISWRDVLDARLTRYLAGDWDGKLANTLLVGVGEGEGEGETVPVLIDWEKAIQPIHWPLRPAGAGGVALPDHSPPFVCVCTKDHETPLANWWSDEAWPDDRVTTLPLSTWSTVYRALEHPWLADSGLCRTVVKALFGKRERLVGPAVRVLDGYRRCLWLQWHEAEGQFETVHRHALPCVTARGQRALRHLLSPDARVRLLSSLNVTHFLDGRVSSVVDIVDAARTRARHALQVLPLCTDTEHATSPLL
jgi:hypothetical protein